MTTMIREPECVVLKRRGAMYVKQLLKGISLVHKGSSLLLTLQPIQYNATIMSRPLRIEYANAWYHVINRGRRRERVFDSKDDCCLFIDILHEAIELFALRVSAFCLMPNHYHLLVQTPDANLSRCMRHINGVYTQRFNSKHSVDGQLGAFWGDALKTIGEQFGIDNYSSVSNVIVKIQDKIKKR